MCTNRNENDEQWQELGKIVCRNENENEKLSESKIFVTKCVCRFRVVFFFFIFVHMVIHSLEIMFNVHVGCSPGK